MMRGRCGQIGLLLTLALGFPAPVSAETPANPSLTAAVAGIHGAAQRRPLALRRLDMAVELRGMVSETIVDASFVNPSAEILEGDFPLTLPAGAVITGYALDIGGRMIDGVLVDRPRAKAVYEARVRQRVDPGLAEIAADGTFQTRIFPIPANGSRKIRLRFVLPVSPATGYRLPLHLAAPRDGWSVAVHSLGASVAPSFVLPNGRTGAMRASDGGYRGRVDAKGEALDGDLLIHPGDAPETLVSLHSSGERYLQLSGPLPPPAARTRPGIVRIYWDRSRSRLDDGLDTEIALARAYVKTLRPRTLELVTFNSSGVERTIVATADELAARLHALHYRGATSFAAIAADGAADACLLFSDGRITIDRAATFAPSCRIDAISSAPDADTAWLRHVASSHGGRSFKLDGSNQAVVLAALATLQPSVRGVFDRDGAPLPFLPLEATAGRWLAVARAPEGGAVTIRLGGIGPSVELRREIGTADQAFDGEGALLASDALALLGANEQRDDYVRLSRRYGIASPSLSFLVLEAPADYVAARIDPPASYPADQRDDVLRLRKEADGRIAVADRDRRADVRARWAGQVAWWKMRFDPAAKPGKPSIRRAHDGLEALPPPPPPAPPPVMAPPPMSAPSAREDVVVTAAKASTPAAQPIAIQIDAWQPDRPYLRQFDAAPDQFDQRFIEQEARHGGIPAFYLDTAEWLRRRGRIADAIEMVLSALELPSANEVTLGLVADRLERYNAFDRAVELRERHMTLDPDRPQPRRFLALALARRAAAQPASARADLHRAIDLLGQVATSPLDGPWDGIDLIALMEANALIPKLRSLGGKASLDPALVTLLDVDLRVVIDWSTASTDLDLWIDEPNGERAIYNNPRTAIGGHLSRDMTQGYGPEEYLLHHAPPGTYAVQANVYAPDRLDPNGPSVLSARLFRNFGRPDEHEERVDIELQKDAKGEKMIGRIIVPPATVPR